MKDDSGKPKAKNEARRANTQSKKGIEKIICARNDWHARKQLIKEEFTKLKEALENISYYECTYLQEEEDFIRLDMGRHPVGMDPCDPKNMDTEGGAAILYSFSNSGEVVCTLFPYTSNTRKPENSKYIIDIFKSPEKISRRQVWNSLHLFLSLCRVSSVIEIPTIKDRTLYKLIFIKDKVYSAGMAKTITRAFKLGFSILEFILGMYSNIV